MLRAAGAGIGDAIGVSVAVTRAFPQLRHRALA